MPDENNLVDHVRPDTGSPAVLSATAATADSTSVPPGTFLVQPVSFAQRSGRLKDRQKRTWEAMAPDFVIEPPRLQARMSVDPGFVLDAAAHFGRVAPLVLEIGSGQGEAVVHAAQDAPGSNFLALEVYRPGVAQTLQRIRTTQVTNVRLVQVDAAEALSTMIPAGSVDEVWVFFPDPWHKSRHTKRRLVTPTFVEQVARVLRPGGVWRLATDWADYARQMREVIGASELFDADLDAPRFTGRVQTSFERKGLEKDRDIADITAVRRG